MKKYEKQKRKERQKKKKLKTQKRTEDKTIYEILKLNISTARRRSELYVSGPH